MNMRYVHRERMRRRGLVNGSEKTKKPFEENSIILLPTEISESKKDIYVFFHICCINNYDEVTNEIIKELMDSQLYHKSKKVFYSVIGKNASVYYKRLERLEKFTLVHINSNINDVEYPILSFLQEFCQQNDCYVCYFHTKGVSVPYDKFRQFWRKRLVQKVIKDHKTCVSLLNEKCDVAGCGWKENPKGKIVNYAVGQYEHFSGNFWWANSDYIKRLPNIREIWKKNLSPNVEFLQYRTGCEFWIGMNKGIQVGINGELNKEYSNTNYYQEHKNKPINQKSITNENEIKKIIGQIQKDIKKV